MTKTNQIGRRGMLGLMASGVAAMTMGLRAQAMAGPVHWQDHFDDLERGAILADSRVRALHFWAPGGTRHRLYPILAPLAGGAVLRRGRAQVVRKVENPAWRPAPELAGRLADLPGRIAPGPENPLGSHALYLDWQGFRIHGRATRAAMRLPEEGIALSNRDVSDLYGLARIGTPVKVV